MAKMTEYRALIVQVARMLGADAATASHDMERVFQMEKELAGYTKTVYTSLNVEAKDWQEIPLVKLSELVPSVPWMHYINKAFNRSGVVIERGQTVLVPGLERMEQIGNWMAGASYRDQANFIIWRMFHQFSSNFLNMEGQQLQESIFEKIAGPFSNEKQRSENCLAQIKTLLPKIEDDLFIAYNLKQAEVDELMSYFESIKTEFAIMIDENEWMDDKTKFYAKEKINAMKAHIGDKIWKSERVQELQTSITENDYVENVLAIGNFFWK